MVRTSKPTKNNWERGQSLVETALVLPLLLIIIAGLVEISNLIVAQNKTETAARAGARFGANGGEPVGVRIAALNALTQTMELDQEIWDMWVFEGTVNISGTAFTAESWSWDHVYGMGHTNNYTSTSEIAIQQQVLADLRSEGDQNAAELQVIGVLMFHDLETILGLDNFIQGLNTVRGFAVMEVAPVMSVEELNGCDAFPLLLEYGQRSINETFYNNIPLQEWDYPTGANRPDFSTFASHVGDIPLSQALEGSVYYFESANTGTGPNSSNYTMGSVNTNFDWIAWNTVDDPSPSGINNNLQMMQASLSWPGNSGINDPLLSYKDPITFETGGMHGWDPNFPNAYDWVSKTAFNTSSGNIKPIMEGHVDNGRYMRMLVYERDMVGGATHPVTVEAPYGAYKIRGFVIGRLIGYQMRGHTNWIIVEVVRWDTTCGQRAP